MRHYRRQRRGDDFITASEMASYAYCLEQWRLETVLGLEPANRTGLKAGTRHHARKAVAERVAGGSIELGRFVAVLATVVLLVLLWWWL
jgi:hypothetical protein